MRKRGRRNKIEKIGHSKTCNYMLTQLLTAGILTVSSWYTSNWYTNTWYTSNKTQGTAIE